MLIADTTTERSRWLVLIQLAITNQKRASVERGCSKVLNFTVPSFIPVTSAISRRSMPSTNRSRKPRTPSKD